MEKKYNLVEEDSPHNPNYYPQIDADLFEKIVDELLIMAKSLRGEKQAKYFSELDVVRSFTKCAQIRNKALPTMIADLMVKHFQSISDMVDSEYGPEETVSVSPPLPTEDWDEKFIDLINYTLKLYAAIRCIRGY